MKDLYKEESGQALVELLLVLPILLLIFFGVWNIGILRDQEILLNMAVRQGARVASIGGDGKRAMELFLAEHSSIDEERLNIEIIEKSLEVEAVATYQVKLFEPLYDGEAEPRQIEARCRMVKLNNSLDRILDEILGLSKTRKNFSL